MEKGYLRKVPENEEPPPEVWYLPHFPIVRMSKSTTKMRIGPKLQRELFDVLILFRRNPIALLCDIQEMFLQIEIEAKDRPLF